MSLKDLVVAEKIFRRSQSFRRNPPAGTKSYAITVFDPGCAHRKRLVALDDGEYSCADSHPPTGADIKTTAGVVQGRMISVMLALRRLSAAVGDVSPIAISFLLCGR